MKNQTALPSLTVNPSNVLPSLPPFLRPPSSPPLSPSFFLSIFHPRADAPSECLSRPWSTNTISPCDPFIVARTSQTVNARPAGTDGEKTRRRRRRRMAGTGLRRHGQPHPEPRRATVGGHGNNIHCADRQGVIDDHRHAHHHHHHRAPVRPRGRSSSSSTNNHTISSKQQRSSSITNSPDPSIIISDAVEPTAAGSRGAPAT